jgi:hypothetical protein
MVDQHNDLGADDRDHELKADAQAHGHASKTFDQFADLAKTDADIRLQREFRQNQDDASGSEYDL